MQLVVVSDEKGRIISLGRPRDVGGPPSASTVAEAEPGQQVHYIDLTPELEWKPLLDLHSKYRVDLKAKRPGLVRIEDSTESKKKGGK